MAINKLTLPYSNFNLGSVIDPDEFNANNSAIVTVVNNLVESANMPPVVDDDGDIVLPDYIKETYIDEVELRSPTITGNTFIGSTGMVGMSALGTADYSVRIWAGGSAGNKESASFRVLQSGEVRVGGTESTPNVKILPNGTFMAGMGGGANNYFKVDYNADGVYNNFAAKETSHAAARWKRDDKHYIYQDPDAFIVYMDGAKLRLSGKDDTHWTLMIGTPGTGTNSGVSLRALHGATRGLEVRNGFGSAYVPVTATDFIQASSRVFKDGIKPAKTSLSLVEETPVYEFKYKGDSRIRTGFIAEESPYEIMDSGSVDEGAISLTDTIGVLWKAVQELSETVNNLK